MASGRNFGANFNGKCPEIFFLDPFRAILDFSKKEIAEHSDGCAKHRFKKVMAMFIKDFRMVLINFKHV